MTRDEKRPERTTYELTEAGRREVASWLRKRIATPLKEYPEFPAVFSFLDHLTPEEARQTPAPARGARRRAGAARPDL